MTTDWRNNLLSSPEVSQYSLREAFRLALDQQGDVAAVSPGGYPLQLEVRTRRGHRFTVQLDNLFADVNRAAPSERAQLVSQHAAAALETARAADGEPAVPTLDQLVPTVKGQLWVDAAPAGSLAVEPLVGDLCIVYALDRAQSMAYVSWPELERFGLDRAALRRAALEALRRRLPPEIGTRGDGKSLMLIAGGNYEASLILLDEVWDQIAPSMPGDLLVCALARDVCLVTATGVPGGLESLEAARDRICARGQPSNFVSRTVLRRDGRAWRPFKPN